MAKVGRKRKVSKTLLARLRAKNKLRKKRKYGSKKSYYYCHKHEYKPRKTKGRKK
jgi:hypothetical protein